jgi:hypothetical protein
MTEEKDTIGGPYSGDWWRYTEARDRARAEDTQRAFEHERRQEQERVAECNALRTRANDAVHEARLAERRYLQHRDAAARANWERQQRVADELIAEARAKRLF